MSRVLGVMLAAAVVTLAGCTASTRSVSTAPPSTVAGGSIPGAASSLPGGEAPTTALPATTAPGRTAGSPPVPTSVTGSGVALTTPPPTVRTTTTTMPPGGAAQQVQLTSADSGRTVTLRIGDTVRLVLDDAGMQWTAVSESQPGVLRPDPAPAPPLHGRLMIWTAVQKGTDTVSSTGTAFCPPEIACPMYARLFQVAIQVS